jgi:hypothetical protein
MGIYFRMNIYSYAKEQDAIKLNTNETCEPIQPGRMFLINKLILVKIIVVDKGMCY